MRYQLTPPIPWAIQDDVDKVIRATADEHVKSLQNTLTMIAHALVRHTTRCQAPQYNLLSHHSKFERIRSDRSRETTVQSSKSHFGTLVGTDNSADSRLKTMTSDENRDNGSATQQFCTDFSPIDPEIPDSQNSQLPRLRSTNYTRVQPCSFPESDPEPTRNDNSTTLDSVSKFSTSSPIPDVVLEISDSVKRSVNGSNASLSYCAAVDTGNAATVVRTAVSSPNPQQWACRAHNPTVSSETLTYLDVQHPVPIKLEDLPSSQADDADVFLADHCYSCSNNDSTRETVNFYPDADPDPLPEVANDLIPNQWTLLKMILTIMATLTEILVNLMSATISAFCINTLADPPELNIIRGLDKHFIHHILRHVIRDHMYIDELISGTNIPLLNVQPDKLLLLRSMKHTLNRATNMVVQHLNDQQRSQFLPRRTPRAFSDIDDAFRRPPDCPMETRCAVAIIYALRLLYITHHRNYFNRDHGLAEHYFYPDHLFAIAKKSSQLPPL
ncbi:hypothetical protein MHU86_13193 [Fragilaria crotonensis]|nr:hypothetical protein MHU86_13193 [Fragilaria crotonensis]